MRPFRTVLLAAFVAAALPACDQSRASAFLSAQIPGYRERCQAGDQRYCEVLADLHVQGTAGVVKDLDRAHTLYTEACARGSATACNKVDPAHALFQFRGVGDAGVAP